MNPVRQVEIKRPPAQRREARRQGRIRCEMLLSTLGPVVDISPLGMQVERVGLPLMKCNRLINPRLKCPLGELHLKAQVVWIKKVSLWRQRIGLAFLELNDETRAHLGRFARFSGCPRIIHLGS